MKNMKRSVALLVAIALLIGCAAGGTIAWLMDSTTPVTNTFTTADVDIELTETFNTDSNDLDTEPDLWQGKMVPGATIAKNPTVTVKAGSEACWLFVKVAEYNRVADADYNFYDYEVASGWTKLDGITLNAGETVYYKVQDAVASDTSYSVLNGNQVTISNKVTKTDMAPFDGKNANGTVLTGSDFDTEMANRPTLTFTAYAVQKSGFDDSIKTEKENAAAAWAQAKTLTP